MQCSQVHIGETLDVFGFSRTVYGDFLIGDLAIAFTDEVEELPRSYDVQ